MVLGMWANVPARFPCLSSRCCSHCDSGHQHRRATQSLAPTTSPLVYLCFITPLRVTSVAVAAPSIMRVPFGIVTRLFLPRLDYRI